MLLRFDPFREFDRIVEQAVGQPRAATMPMDAYRRDDRFVIHFDLPGVDPATIDVSVDQNVLTVTAERSWAKADGDQVVANERRQGTFSRQLLLGDALDKSAIHAGYDRGVLTVTIPVAEKAKPRKITVGVTTEAAPELVTAN